MKTEESVPPYNSPVPASSSGAGILQRLDSLRALDE